MMHRTVKGAVSAYVMISLTVLLTASLGVSSLAINSLTRVRQDRNSVIAQQASFAALDHITGKAFGDLEANNGKLVYTALDVSSDVNAIAPGAVANVWVTPSGDKLGYVTATVTYKGITRSVRSYIQAKEVGIWNNAVFAGSGASGQAVNGNVDIRGSMHILGDGEPYTDLNGNGVHDNAEAFTDKNKNGVWDPGEAFVDGNGDGVYTTAEPFNDTNSNGIYDPPLTQTSLDTVFGGSAHVGNNYSGIPGTLSALIPAIPTISGVGTLGAEVRVKHGMISINGSASVGNGSPVDGGLSKATIDGSYVNDGYTGNQGASSVYSDNGTTNTYDLGNLGLQFPIITGIGAQTYTDKTGTQWTTHKQYLDTKSLTIPLTTITETTPAFSYGPDANGNSISFVPKTATTSAKMTINGVVKVAGGFQLGNPKDNITYSGSGTLYADGNMNIDCSLLPAAGLKFPTTTRIGLISKGNMNLATGSGSAQLYLAGAFYAQGTIKSAKQNQIAGTFVASFFDMGTNVPNIYQVPNLVSNMPPAMPGDKRYFTLKVRTFRDRSPLVGQSDSFNGGTPYSGSTGGSTTGGFSTAGGGS